MAAAARGCSLLSRALSVPSQIGSAAVDMEADHRRRRVRVKRDHVNYVALREVMLMVVAVCPARPKRGVVIDEH